MVYAVTNNQKGNKTNNLRDAQSTKANLIQTYQNDELVIVNSVSDDGLWYDVTVVRDGNRGYMRDYLLTQISEADALKRIDEINAAATPPTRRRRPRRARRRRPRRAKRHRPRRDEETQTPTGEETQTPTGEETPKPAPEQMTFPAYGITVRYGGDDPAARRAERRRFRRPARSRQINKPTPVRIERPEDRREGEQVWYQIENLNNGDTGYVEAYNVRVVTEQEARDAVETPAPTVPPIETPTPGTDRRSPRPTRPRNLFRRN